MGTDLAAAIERVSSAGFEGCVNGFLLWTLVSALFWYFSESSVGHRATRPKIPFLAPSRVWLPPPQTRTAVTTDNPKAGKLARLSAFGITGRHGEFFAGAGELCGAAKAPPAGSIASPASVHWWSCTKGRSLRSKRRRPCKRAVLPGDAPHEGTGEIVLSRVDKNHNPQPRCHCGKSPTI
jgi:hypothetical protein